MIHLTDWEKGCLAAALCDDGKMDIADVCPHCGESKGVRATHCTDCGKTLLYWQTRSGHDVLAYEE